MEASNVTENPPTTLYELREAIRSELAWFIGDQAMDGTPPSDEVQIDVEQYARGAAVVRDLSAALESLDRAVWQNTPSGAQVTPPFNVDALAVSLWNASQDAGGSTSVGDAVVAELRSQLGQ